MSSVEFEQVPTWWQQENFQDFRRKYLNHKRALFFVGSGLSRCAGLPDWPSLLGELAALCDSEVQAEIAERIRERTSEAYKQAGSVLKEALGERWRPALDGIFKAAQDPKRTHWQQPYAVHRALVSLQWKKIITTNYDRLLEGACQYINLPVEPLHYKSVKFREIVRHQGENCIVHLHGDIADPGCELILAEEDYVRHYSDDWQFCPKRPIADLLREAQVILFLGYSYDDKSVTDLIKWALEGISEPSMFALVPRKERQPEFASRLREQSQAHCLRYISFSRADKYGELRQLLEYMQDPDKWDAVYKERLSVRRPTVVFIRGGGTISARPRPRRGRHDLDIDHVESRYDEGLQELAEELLRRYRWQSELPPEIVWEILPPEQQLLSVNTVVDDWNHATLKLQGLFAKYFAIPDRVGTCAEIFSPDIQELFAEEAAQYALTFHGKTLTDRVFMDGFRNRYVLGFVFLYGTDTLAFLASALAFGLRQIPCSVVITGANKPLFSQDFGVGFDSTSDGWRNLANALFFLQCFGHRLTEFLVVFGDTVHNAVNLWKRAVDAIPYDREHTQVDPELFMYRNLSITGQYMFRLIDGVFCNNYYAARTPTYKILPLEKLWHFRQNPFPSLSAPVERPDRFSHCVKNVTLNPSFPRIDVPTLLEKQGEETMRVLLVEGYNSGNFPSVSTHHFARLLSELDERGIPVVLVSRYGTRATQTDYRTLQIFGREVPVLRLFGIVVETALPLLSIVVGNIPSGKWADPGKAGRGGTLTEYRIEAVRIALNRFFEDRTNILSEELKFCANREEMFDFLKRHQDIENNNRRSREPRHGSDWIAMQEQAACHGGPSTGVTMMPRAEFMAFLEDSFEQFEKVGALPDGFLTLNTQGFALGEALANHAEKRNRSQGHPGSEAMAGHEVRLQRAEALLRDLTSQLTESGIAAVVPGPVRLAMESGQAVFSFDVKVNRGEPTSRTDRRYTATGFSDEEVKLFCAMSNGCPADVEIDAYEGYLHQLYEVARDRTWLHATHNLDWFILGFFKGVGCQIARLFGFDQGYNEPPNYPNKDRQREIRQSVQCHPFLLYTEGFGLNTEEFGFQFRCIKKLPSREGQMSLRFLHPNPPT